MDHSPVQLEDRLDRVDRTGETLARGGAGQPLALPMLAPQRSERADAARNRATILAAAEQLIASEGAAVVTMDRIACAAGVGKGTLFRHFGDRCGLMRALLDERERAFQEAFIRGCAPLGPGAPAHERLVAFGEQMLEHIEIQGDLLLAAENGAPGERLRHSVYGAYRAHVAALLADSGWEGDVSCTADALLASLASELVLFQRRELGYSQARLQRCWRELVRALMPCN
jgi:AcrR family transcriptional regulator